MALAFLQLEHTSQYLPLVLRPFSSTRQDGTTIVLQLLILHPTVCPIFQELLTVAESVAGLLQAFS